MSLPLEKLDRLALQKRLDDIGATTEMVEDSKAATKA